MEENTNVALSVTDIIRRDIMAYLWGDDEISCARMLQEIFETLSKIDDMFVMRDDDVKRERRRYLETKMELSKLKREFDQYIIAHDEHKEESA